jgi:Cu/Ag efflux protein CusF
MSGETVLSRRACLSIAAALGLAACSKQKPAAPVKRYKMTGEVKRLEPERQIAVVQHDEIEGWMEPMTMEFPVKSKTEFAKLAEGKRIRAVVEVQDLDYWLTEIETE